ncbi:hypothetical protein ACIOEX_26115 [Streptomyces sp. NPDC087850]|uniref:hypothetical protein n=1 Tax=Streptomyces sp. NPDC087850 TaxID=3365809 RepID=UPI0038238A1C
MHPRQLPKLRDEVFAHYAQYDSQAVSPMVDGATLYWASEQQVKQTARMADELDDHSGMLDYAPCPQGFMWLNHTDPATLGLSLNGHAVPFRVFSWDKLSDPWGKMTIIAWCLTKEVPPQRPGRFVGPLMPVIHGRFGPEPEDHDVSVVLARKAVDAEPTLLHPLLAMWYRMSLPRFATMTTSRPTTAQAKRAKNTGRPLQELDVTLVDVAVRPRKLSAASSEPGATAGRTLDYRQEVSGFWRMQHYGPESSLRKKIWVDSYERGPEDAPKRPKKTTVKVFK